MSEASPGLLLPAGRGAAVPQPLRRPCKTDRHHSGGGDRLTGWANNKPTVLPAFPTQQEAVEVARDITSPGPLSLP